MYQLHRFVTLLLFPLFFPVLLAAQPTDSDIRPMLKSLTYGQKLQLLEYLRFLGADMDAEIQHSYQKVAPRDQFKTIQFIKSLKQGIKTSALTAVSWDRDTLFFGDLEEGTMLIDSFTLTNNGNAPYRISGAQTTCNCAILRAPAHPVMPGESAVVRVEFNSSDKLGASTPAVIIYDNSTPNKRHILYLHGNIIARKKPRKYPWED